METLTIKEAIEKLRVVYPDRPAVSRTAIVSWVDKYNLGYKLGGRWIVDEEKFENFIKGKRNEKE